MNSDSRWHVAALGLGIISASLAGWMTGSFWPNSTAADFARAMGLTFLGFFGLGALLHELPVLWAMLWYHVREMERLRLEAARFRFERTNLALTAPATQPITLNHYEREWREFYAVTLAYCLKHLDGDPVYKAGMDGIIDYSSWRRWAEPLIRAKILEPIYQGSRTRWQEGWSAARLAGQIDAGKLPPCPDEAPPVIKPSNS